MKVTKDGLVNILLDRGDEDTAVLIARSALPDELDLDQAADTLDGLGLGVEERAAIAERLHAGRHDPDDERSDSMRRTISNRWAELVTDWTAAGSARQVDSPSSRAALP